MDRVLFVDNDTLVLNSLKRGLLEEPYLKFYATSGEDALRILETNTISVLITAMKMKGMTGLDLLRIVKDKYPDLVKIVLSGYVNLPQILVTVNQGDIFRFITKPYNLEEELKGTIREAIESYNFWVNRRETQEGLEKENISFGNLLKTYESQVRQLKFEIGILQVLSTHWQQKQHNNLLQWTQHQLSKEDYLEEMIQANELLTQAFSQIPTRFKLFSASQILKDVLKHAEQKNRLKNVDYGISGNASNMMTGRYGLILFLINSIIEWGFHITEDQRIKLVISGDIKEESVVLLTVLLEADEKLGMVGIGATSVLEWLKELAGKFGIEMVRRTDKGQVSIVLSTLCKPESDFE